MSIVLTSAQAAALASIAAERGGSLLLRQVGEDPDLFVATAGEGEPDLVLRPDGTRLPVEPHHPLHQA
ncbi:MAG: hypothetical protein JST31_05315 [Actinobacteria bacterium]|nr:hypothetical protein [Actinomycetota bacterium]